MKTFSVSYAETLYDDVTITAKTKAQAKLVAKAILGEHIFDVQAWELKDENRSHSRKSKVKS